MDDTVYNEIEMVVDEVLFLQSDPYEKEKVTALIENLVEWAIRYTHGGE